MDALRVVISERPFYRSGTNRIKNGSSLCHGVTNRARLCISIPKGVTFSPEDQQLCGRGKSSLLSRAARLAKRAKVGDEMRDEDEVLQLVPTFINF